MAQPSANLEDLLIHFQQSVDSLQQDMVRKAETLQNMIVKFKDLHNIGVQIKEAIRQGIFVEDNEPSEKDVVHSSNATTDGSTAVECSEVDPITTSLISQRPTISIRHQARNFHPLYMSLSQALQMLRKKGHLELLEPQPLSSPLPSRYDPTKHCTYHQQHGHDTNRCIRLRHKIQDLIDEEIIAPPKGPQATINLSPPHLNLIHILPSTYDPSIFITPAHLPKPAVFIPESTDLCMMDAPESQSSQTCEPTTSELMRMIKDLQRTVTDLASGTLAPSSTTPHTGNFMSKGSPVLGRATSEECQSLGKVEASGKNKIGAGMDPHEHLLLAVEALKAEGLDKEQVLTVVAKTVDDTFATQVGGSLNQEASRKKGRCIKNVPFRSNPVLGRDQQVRPAPTNPFAGAPSKNPQALKYQPRGQRVFHALHMPLSKAFQILVEQGHLKPLQSQPLPKNLPLSHNPADYCAFHQRAGHDTDMCFRLRHEVQDLFDNGVILPPSSAKSIGTGSVNLGDNVIM